MAGEMPVLPDGVVRCALRTDERQNEIVAGPCHPTEWGDGSRTDESAAKGDSRNNSAEQGRRSRLDLDLGW
jgi:hypothetical protein